jgi:pyruvate dehydrogenase E2 component (dihydrolipoamide acetyltransferase)
MTEGVIAGWQKQVGDTVKKGDVLADIETDKATMELESYKDGVLLYQGAKAGEKILVNDLLCIIGKPGQNITDIVAASKNIGTAAPVAAPATPTQTAASPAPVAAAPVAEVVVNEGRIFASPLAKKIANEKGIDLRFVKGSGDNGRITKSDIDTYTPAESASVAPVTTSAPAAPAKAATAPVVTVPAGEVSFVDTPVSQMRKVIARRLSESLFTAPHFYLTMSIDMDAAVAARAKINEVAKTKISFNDMVLKATALSLKQHPKVNSSWLGDTIRTNYHVNIGVAVAVEEGLLVPVVRFADGKSLSQIGAEVKDFAQKAKDKKLQPSDWEGSTFTISNLGMFGIEEFTAIINPPDACILAVGGISQVPVVKNGQVVPGNVMKLTLSCDHRVVDGATGAAFLQTLKSLLEEPLRMLV